MLPFIKLFLKEKYQNFKTINTNFNNTNNTTREE